ncbi:MAG: hypothetical protein PUB87_08750 [Eubacteriaceae bacterium]|nr:hypothetical protein [Eubacteriaceae bacterium]
MEKNNTVIRLHLELDLAHMSDREIEILKKYGSMKESISRDILVPADITLHALNYVILRAFGWQNGHLHHFALPDEVFDELTEQKFYTWSKLAGVYFRFPSENFEDIYWDDNYKENENLKSWMKRKYTGPYKYKGNSEHYLYSQLEVRDFFERYPVVTVQEVSLYEESKPYQVNPKDASVYQVQNAFVDIFCHELIERIPLMSVLQPSFIRIMPMSWIRHGIMEKLAALDVERGLDVCERNYYCSGKSMREVLESYNVTAEPVTHLLHYRYDYGDGWEVSITAEDVYCCDEETGWTRLGGDMKVDIPFDTLEEVVEKYRPVCIAKDGIELIDDVGGISGFCDFLESAFDINLNDPDYKVLISEAGDMLNWAYMMGWTGKWISPKKTL